MNGWIIFLLCYWGVSCFSGIIKVAVNDTLEKPVKVGGILGTVLKYAIWVVCLYMGGVLK